MGDCPFCETNGVVFEGKLINRCIKCMKDIPKQDDFELEDSRIYEVYSAYSNGEYNNKLPFPNGRKLKEDHVFDEDKSVKWNREEVIRHNEALVEAQILYREESNRLNAKLWDDIVQALVDDYGFNKKQANIIYSYAYNKWHSHVSDLFNNLKELAEMIKEFITHGG